MISARMNSSQSLKLVGYVILIGLALTGCISGQQLVTENAVDLFQNISLATNRQSDIPLVRQGLPSFLMMINGMIETYPENPALLLAGAQAYSSYASLLEEEESARSAQLIQQAKIYALKSLDLSPPFKGMADKKVDLFAKHLEEAEKNHVSLLFWVGSIWGTWIAQGPDGVEGLADLPKVEALMNRILELDPGFYYGGPHLFKGILLSVRPVQFGGDLKKAQFHFQQALDFSKGKFLMTSVYYAQYYAKQRLDRDLFVQTLTKVLSTPADIEPDLTLINTLAHQKAKKLQAQVDELF